MRKKRVCPDCQSTSCAKILYGYMAITEELDEKLSEQKVVLGGCCVTDNDPDWECNDCGNRW